MLHIDYLLFIFSLLSYKVNHWLNITEYGATRVKCNYPGKTITFKVDSGSNDEYFASLIEFEDGAGDLNAVNLKQALDQDSWLPMQRSWGAVWKLDHGSALKAPFSIRLTTSGQTIVANNVIPAGWKPGQTYRSVVNFAT